MLPGTADADVHAESDGDEVSVHRLFCSVCGVHIDKIKACLRCGLCNDHCICESAGPVEESATDDDDKDSEYA